MRLTDSEIDDLRAKSRAVAVHCRGRRTHGATFTGVQKALRQLYDRYTREPIPPDLAEFLKRLS